MKTSSPRAASNPPSAPPPCRSCGGTGCPAPAGRAAASSGSTLPRAVAAAVVDEDELDRAQARPAKTPASSAWSGGQALLPRCTRGTTTLIMGRGPATGASPAAARRTLGPGRRTAAATSSAATQTSRNARARPRRPGRRPQAPAPVHHRARPRARPAPREDRHHETGDRRQGHAGGHHGARPR